MTTGNDITVGTVSVSYPPQDGILLSDQRGWFALTCAACDWVHEADEESALHVARLHSLNQHNELSLTDQQTEYVDSLYSLAAWLLTHPQTIPQYGGVSISQWVYSDLPAEYDRSEDGTVDYDKPLLNKAERDADVKSKMAALARVLAPCEKVYADGQFSLVRKFGYHTVTLATSREAVCRKVVVGTEKVERTDPAAPKITVEQEVVEWVCDEPLLAADKAGA